MNNLFTNNLSHTNNSSTNSIDSDNTLSLTLYSIIFASTLILSAGFSYKFQKDFTSQTKPSKFLIILMTTIIILIVSLYSIITIDVFNLNLKNINSGIKHNSILNESNNESKLNPNNYIITIILTIINTFFYIILPFSLLYFIEEKNVNNYLSRQNNNNEHEEIMIDDEDGENSENNNFLENQISCNNLNQNSALNYNLLKNFFYYIQAFILINLIYLVIFKINYYDSTKTLMRYSKVPDGLRKYSHLNSDIEILNYTNFLVLISVTKLFSLIYIPYGAGKIISTLIDNLKGGETMKKEYHHLNTNFSKNYETIKNLTSQKLMTGKLLTKKEKQILKTCKETETILQHKQEVLEDKFSKWKMCLFYMILPIKFILIFISILFVILFVTSKIILLYTQMEKSICGIDCGYISNTEQMGLSIQTLLEKVNSKNLQIFINFSIFAFFINYAIKSMKNLGLINLIPNRNSHSTNEVRGDKILSIIYYSLFFILTILNIVELFSISPYFSSFNYANQGMNQCDVYDLDSVNCKISYFGIFYLKSNSNFALFKYWDIFYQSSLIFLLIVSVIYYPIKSVINFRENENEQDEVSREINV